MKTITICAVLLALGASYFFMTSTNSVASIEDQYQLYLAEYGKTVSNGEEYQTRLRIFADNLKAIEEINSKQSSYKVAINKFADVIPKDNLGYTPSSTQSYHTYDGPLADSIDWREKGAVHPVKDQGFCRSG